ncbi:MAG: DUF4105 domain-containing protein [Bacteroidales bacterium]
MKRTALLSLLFMMLLCQLTSAQVTENADVYLLTCAPGNATYSIYGHTALRICVSGTEIDRVYNWGIFDFSTPNFAFRFAKGRLDYMLGSYSYDTFIYEYVNEGRAVWSQPLNLTTAEKRKLFSLINENLKPENVKYRYDFFFDNCATRIRDILVASASDSIIFPVKEKQKSFRQLVDPNQKVLPWIDFGADMLLGLQADRKASPADEMFLPAYLMENLSASVIVHDGNREPILGEPVTVVDMPAVATGARTWMPQLVFYLVLLFVILVTFVLGKPLLGRITDIVLYIIFSVLALLLIFTNFFSEHDALHFNLLILGINPLIPVLTGYILAGKKAVLLSRIALIISLLWIPVSLIAGQGINPALIPLVLIIIVRLFKHSGFGQ